MISAITDNVENLWAKFQLELRIQEWASLHDIPLEPVKIHKIEPTLIKPNAVTNFLQFQAECKKCTTVTKLAHFLQTLLTEEQKDHAAAYSLWINKLLADGEFASLEEMERKFILLLALHTINDKVEEDNPFCTPNVSSELLDFTEALALEQAFHGKTAQELETLISLFLPQTEQRQFKRQLLEILGGHHADLLTDPLSSPAKRNSAKANIPKHINPNHPKRGTNDDLKESKKLRRLSEVAIRRIQNHRVVDVADVQLQPRRRSFDSQNSQPSPFVSFSQPPLTSPPNNLTTTSIGNNSVNTSGGSIFGVKNYKRNNINKNII